MSKNNNNRKQQTERERISREARIDRTIREYLTVLRKFIDCKNKLIADCVFDDATKKLRKYCKKHWDAVDAQTKAFFDEPISTALVDDELLELADEVKEHTHRLRKLNLPYSVDMEEEACFIKHVAYDTVGEVDADALKKYIRSMLSDDV